MTVIEGDPPYDVLGEDTTATCLRHRKRVTWIPAPGWWIHSDSQSCMALWDVDSPIILIPKKTGQ